MALTKETNGLREALEALTRPIPDHNALRHVIDEHAPADGAIVGNGIRAVAPWIAVEMIRWLDDDQLAARMSLEQYACLLARVEWPPPPFIDPTVYCYLNLPTVQTESIGDLRDLVDRSAG